MLKKTFLLVICFCIIYPLISYSADEEYVFVRQIPEEVLGLRSPEGITVDMSGNVYVADTGNHCIKKFDSNGKLLTKWGGYGFGDGQFSEPTGIAVDKSGNVYVTDKDGQHKESHRIQKFDSNGKFLTKWGYYGQGDEEFNFPFNVEVDNEGNVYVTDHSARGKKKFDSSGKFLAIGQGGGQFNSSKGVAMDSSGNKYVADTQHHRIQKFDSNGNFLTKWGDEGSNDKQLNMPKGIAVDGSGNLYVGDPWNGRIQKLDADGNLITKWEAASKFWSGINDIALDNSGNVYSVGEPYKEYYVRKFDSNGKLLAEWGTWGQNDGQFKHPTGIAVDNFGNIYVTDPNGSCIQKFDSNGNFVARLGNMEGTEPLDPRVQWLQQNKVTDPDSNGQLDKPIEQPYGIAVDSLGNVYVVEHGYFGIEKGDGPRPRILKFDTNGKFLTKKSLSKEPHDVAIDNQGNIYVVERYYNSILKFNSNYKGLAVFGKAGSGQGEFCHPESIVIDGSGNIYVADTGNHRIQIFRPKDANKTKKTNSK